MVVIKDYVERWETHQYFWQILTKAAHDICETGVHHKLKLKCNVTSRTKSHESIGASIERRQKARGIDYQKDEEIEEDMIDLSGIRIILTFPGDVDEVHRFLETEFDDVHRSFWGLDENGNVVTRKEKGPFIGYRATHFVVKWRQSDEKRLRYGTAKKHHGKKIEIQVTSTAMYAWQQAHHDLVYKQLQGNPSEEERSLLEMINGLAHAGEMALAQLQRLSRRRIDKDTRKFADEYEVGVWLKTHMNVLLGFDSPIDAPFLERSVVLFDILSLLDLRTPRKLREALSQPFHRGLSHQLSLGHDLALILADTLSKEKDLHKWKDTFRDDPADWAIFRICVNQFRATRIVDPRSAIQKARLKAFCLVNTTNFALSEPSRHDYIEKILEDILSEFQTEQEKCAAKRTLQVLVSEQVDQISEDKLIREMEVMWCRLLQWIRETTSTFLCIALAMSLAGVTFIPQADYSSFSNQPDSPYMVWPFSLDPDEVPKLGLKITSTFGDDRREHELKNLQWIRTRILLGPLTGKGIWKQAVATPKMRRSKTPTPTWEPAKPVRRTISRDPQRALGDQKKPEDRTEGSEAAKEPYQDKGPVVKRRNPTEPDPHV